MSELKLRPEVAAFAQLMERNLRADDHKGGWDDMSNVELLSSIKDEYDELDRAARVVGIQDRKAKITHEAADVANFAMMIADNCGGLES